MNFVIFGFVDWFQNSEYSVHAGKRAMNFNDIINGTGSWLHNYSHHELKTEEHLSLDYVILPVMVVCLAVVGTIGNVPILIVYIQRKDRKASSTFIKVLALLDLLVCACVMPYTAVYEFHLVTSDVTCRLFEFLRHFAVMASNLTLVAIAAERYIAVCRIDTRLNDTCVNKGVLAVFVIGLVTAMPSVGIFAVVNSDEVTDVPCSFPHYKTRGYFCHFTYSILGSTLVTAYQTGQLMIFVIGLCLIVTLYTAVYVVLWRKTKRRRRLALQRDVSGSGDHQTPCTRFKYSCQVLIQQTNAMTDITTGKLDFQSKVVTRGKRLIPEEFQRCRDKMEESACRQSADYNQRQISEHTPAEAEISLADNMDLTTINNKCPAARSSINGARVTFKKVSSGGESQQQVSIETSYDVTNNVKLEAQDDVSIVSSVNSRGKTKIRRYCHRRTARMLFLCTLIYFLTWIPFWLDIFGITNSLVLRYTFFIGNATNPLVYGIVNRKVRRSVRRLFLDCLSTCFKTTSLAEKTNFETSCPSVTNFNLETGL